VIVWAEPGKAPLVMTTISPGRIAPLADALAEYLDRNPGDPGTG
jgi:hypothetical protein